jgi:signal transduction histidine kinase
VTIEPPPPVAEAGGDQPYRFALPEDQKDRDRLAELGTLAGGLVHEIKNPLGAIGLNVDLLLEACGDGALDPDRSERRLKRIQAGVKHLDHIVRGFLSFARPGKPDWDRIDCNGLIQSLLEEQGPVFEAAEISTSLHGDPDLRAAIGDHHQLKSVILNILLNARDALRERGDDRRILIATRNKGDGIRLVIANNGPPLPEHVAAHLFEPFFSGKEGGTGLGLAIAARLIDLHNGRITVSSDPDQGVSFTIELPTTLGPARSRSELPLPEAEAVVIDD